MFNSANPTSPVVVRMCGSPTRLLMKLWCSDSNQDVGFLGSYVWSGRMPFILDPSERPTSLVILSTVGTLSFLNNHISVTIETLSKGFLLLTTLDHDNKIDERLFGEGKVHFRSDDGLLGISHHQRREATKFIALSRSIRVGSILKHSVLNGFFAHINGLLEDPKSRELSEVEGVVEICAALIIKFDEVSPHLLSLKSGNSHPHKGSAEAGRDPTIVTS
ncbi:hypothetical protein BJ742DRAFT_767350 [Cladochytrium replicatum]|nr:hypothetical protein BJ742DRAFT_767350 [Cladochytrium replicatum]